MEDQKKPEKKKKSILKKLLRIFGWIVLSIIGLLLLAVILIQLPPVQNFTRKKVVSYLEKKLHTRVAIAKINLQFPTSISLRKVYFEDQAQDTLLYGNKIKVDISMWQLVRNEINIRGVYLDSIVTNLKRKASDSTFNFQYIIDAFTSEQEKDPQKEDSSTMQFSVHEIQIDNSHFVFNDLYTGNDLNLKLEHFKTTIKTFDLAKLSFDIDLMEAKGLSGYFHQLVPGKKAVEEVVSQKGEESGTGIQISNKTLHLSDINFQFNSDVSHLKSSYIIGDAELHPKDIDLENMLIALNDASLEKADIRIELAPGQEKSNTEEAVPDSAAPGLKIIADKLTIEKSNFKMDNLSAPAAPSGMDFNHLGLTGINLDVRNILYSTDTMQARVKSASLKDRSGFVLNKMEVDFGMYPTGIKLDDLYIKTPQSEIKRSASINYPSLASLSENPGLMGLNVDLDNSRIAVKDILFFMPEMEAQLATLKKESIFVEAGLKGRVNDLQIQKLVINGLSGTDINVRGSVGGLPDAEKMNANLNLIKFSTNRRDILALLPPSVLPADIPLPSQLALSGVIRGGMAHLNTDLALKSSLGDMTVKGTLSEISDKVRAKYDLDVAVRKLQLGEILSNAELGDFTLRASASGTGYDPQTAVAQFGISIPEAGYHQYNYKNIRMTGEINQGALNGDLNIHDPNIETSLSLKGDFSKEFPAVTLQGVIDSVDVMALHFASKPLKYHGQVQADFSNTNPDSLTGELYITHNIIATDKQRLLIDTVSVTAESGDTNRLSVSTGFASLQLQGRYKLTQLGNIIQNTINPYFKISDNAAGKETEPYHFSLTGQVLNNPALKALLPDLENMKPIELNSHFDRDSGFNFHLTSPHLQYAAMVVDSLNLKAGTQDSVLALHLGLNKFMSGNSIVVYKTNVDGTLRDNKLNLGIGIADKDSKQKYHLSGTINQQEADDYVFSLRPDSLLLNYDKWTVNPDNEIAFGKNGIMARNFVLNQDNQTLSAQSQSTDPASPLELTFKDFQISTLTGFVQSDSLIANGLLNGKAIIKNIQTNPTFTSDLTVNDLSVYQDTLGILTAKVDNETANQFQASITLNGRGNDIALNGKYFVKPENSDFDLILDINQFRMRSIEGLTNGALREGHGYIYGRVRANGNMENKNIDGRLQFDSTSFRPAALNSVFRIDKESIAIINNEGIRFNSFTIRDTTNNTLTLGGMIRTKDWENFSFDMNIRANNFQAINSTAQDNNLFYGKLVFSTRLNVKGTPTQPIVDGNLSIGDSTSFTVVLPSEDPGIEKREGIVRFVDFSATAEDSIFMAPFDSLKTAPLVGYDVAINIDISKEAEFNLIVDPANGDFLHMRGSGQLSGGIDPSGKVNLTGEYLVEDGSYSLSFNFLKRMFLIQKGSKITWTGDPTTAKVDITAIYQTNTAPYELVKSMLPGNSIFYKQKLPFEVMLKMENELLKPEISFDIVLPDKNYTVGGEVIGTVEQRLEQMRQEPSDLNKQVFALLLLNRFVGENPFETGSGGMDAGTFAKQSASRLLTEQLNNLTEGLIEGVDLNFDLASTEDYSTGQKQDRTNLKVGVTKRLLNDRLSVTVGNNFELEGPQQSNQSHSGIADNISINYSLSKDGRYMLRAYRNNDYTGALEGYVIETGVSFIITLDYDRLAEIFRSKSEREKKREIRRYNRDTDREGRDWMNNQRRRNMPSQSEPEKPISNEQ